MRAWAFASPDVHERGEAATKCGEDFDHGLLGLPGSRLVYLCHPCDPWWMDCKGPSEFLGSEWTNTKTLLTTNER